MNEFHVQRSPRESTEFPRILAIIAGSGQYPFAIARGARQAGVERIVAAAFKENTLKELAREVDEMEWLRVGQLGGLLNFLRRTGATHAIMAGQIHPGHLYNLFPDAAGWLLLGRLRLRNATTIFSAIADRIENQGCVLLEAYRFAEDHLAPVGLIAGPLPNRKQMADAVYAFKIARDISNLEVGQTVVVRNGSVLAVEAREGTDATLVRGGTLGNRKAIAVKVAKTSQDPRFDLPVIGPSTIEIAVRAGIRLIGVEAGITMMLEPHRTKALAQNERISVFGLDAKTVTNYQPLHPLGKGHRVA